MGGNTEVVIEEIYNTIIREGYIENNGLIGEASKRFKELGGWFIPNPDGNSQIAPLALELLLEAEMAYCFKLQRSAIFYSATALDAELRRCLVKHCSASHNDLKRTPFGGAITCLKKTKIKPDNTHLIINLEMVNGIRNKLAVHGAHGNLLISFDETRDMDDHGKYDVEALEIVITLLQNYCSEDEIESLQIEGYRFENQAIDMLAFKVVTTTMDTISLLDNCFWP